MTEPLMLRIFASLAFAFLVVLAPRPASAASADDAVLRAYTLNMDKLTRVGEAYDELTRAAENDPALQAEIEAMEEEPDETLADKRAAYTKHPKVWAFFQRRGVSLDDLVVGVKAAANALVAAASTNPQAFAAYVSPAQMAFGRENKAALQRLFERFN